MSPLMFLLIVESLRKLFHMEKIEGNIRGIKIARVLSITHLLFLDDAVLFGTGSIEEWNTYKNLLDLFCSATGMAISDSKSMFLEFGISLEVKDHIHYLFPFNFMNLEQGFKLFGFSVKAK